MMINQKITAPDIERLFDAIAKDEGKDSDADFQDQNEPEALTKAVNRARSMWHILLKPDK